MSKKTKPIYAYKGKAKVLEYAKRIIEESKEDREGKIDPGKQHGHALALACIVLDELEKKKMKNKPRVACVIESPDSDDPWGISFSDHNPKPEDYFGVKDKETAFRLKDRINNA